MGGEMKEVNKFKEAYRLHQGGHFDDAQKIYEEILINNPKHFDSLHLLEVILTKSNPQKAVDLISSAIEINPTLSECFVNAANALIQLGQYEVAMSCCYQATAIKSDSWQALHCLGFCLSRLNRGEEALEVYDKALSLAPNVAGIYLGRGAAYEAQYRFSEALQDYDKAIKLKSDFADAHTNRGNALMALGIHDEALKSHNRAIQFRPDFADAHMNNAVALLAMGDFRSGWSEYSWRLEKDRPDLISYPSSKPYLEPTGFNSRILVLSEQGVGDHIFFGRLLSELKVIAQDVVARVDYRLIPLFQRSMPDIHFIPEGLIIPENLYDFQIFIGELPRYFRNSIDDFLGKSDSYLVADKERATAIRRELCIKGEILIGISWKSKNATVGQKRSLDLSSFSAALNIPGVKLVNLQYGDVSAEIAQVKSELGVDVLRCATVDNMSDLDGLASLIEACDLVISADNTTVHLAGALGKPVWICLPAIPNWRWMMEVCDSPWYPSAKLYRQDRLGDWGCVLDAIGQDCLEVAGLV